MNKDKEILNRFKLMMNYNSSLTLNENKDTLQLDEQFEKEGEDLLSALLKGGEGVERNVLKNIISKTIGGINDIHGVKLNTVDEVFNALKAGELAPAAMGKLRTGLLRSGRIGGELRSALINDYTSNVSILNKYKGKSVQDIQSALERLKYSPEDAQKMAEEINAKNTGKINQPDVNTPQQPGTTTTNSNINYGTNNGGVNFGDVTGSNNVFNININAAVKNAEEVGSGMSEAMKKIPITAWTKIKSVGKKLAKSWLYMFGLIGVGGGSLYLLGKLSGDKDIQKMKKDGNGFDTCALDLLAKPNATMEVTSTGDPVITIKNTGNPEFDKVGGLYFYHTNRVISVDTTKRGTWTCMAEQNPGIGNIRIVWDGEEGQQNNTNVTATESTLTPNDIVAGKTVGVGTRGPIVTAIQQMLVSEGTKLNNPIIAKVSESGVPDGKYGPLTKAAVTEFQRVNNIKVDGVVGPETWGKLYPTPEQQPTPETTKNNETPIDLTKETDPLSKYTVDPNLIDKNKNYKEVTPLNEQIKFAVKNVLEKEILIKNSVKKILEEEILKK